MLKSSVLVAWISDGRPSFLLWLRLRLFIVFGEGIWRCIPCYSAMDFFRVVKLPRVKDAQWIVRLNTVYWHDFKGVQLVIISVSFCDLGVGLNTQDLVKFLRRHLFQDISKMARLAPASQDFRSFTVLWSRAYFDYVIPSDRVELLCCFVWNYRKPGNIYLLEMALNFWLGLCSVLNLQYKLFSTTDSGKLVH